MTGKKEDNGEVVLNALRSAARLAGVYDKNLGMEAPPGCQNSPDGHRWEKSKVPIGVRSGIHAEKCVHCKIVVRWDTSD